MTTPPDHITGAELQTLRESCGLSREDLAGLARVQARTVKHWESGRAGVPSDVAALVARLDESISQAVNQARHVLADPVKWSGTPPADVVLMRYASAEDLARYRPDMAGMPAGVHGAIVARLRASLAWLPGFGGVPVRVVWMQRDIYEPWRTACQLPDDEATRSQWAAQQVAVQALPHRADQPPAG